MNEMQMQEYFTAHAVDGALPDEEVIKLLTGTADEAIGGETGDTDGDAPTPAETETTAEEETPKEEAQAEAQQAEPVIMARDGKNTIPYSELVDAREAAQNERSRREELERRLAELEARIQGGGTAQAADEGAEEGVEADQDDDPLAALREDWPEVADALAKVTAQQQQQIAALNGQMAPIQQSEAERQMAAHYTTILQAHPDADDIINSQEFASWRDAQPSFVRDVQEAVLQRGTAAQVVELFDSFKKAHNSKNLTPDDGDDRKLEENDDDVKSDMSKNMERQQTRPRPPRSLSDIPGGSAVQTDPTEAFIAMSETARMDKIMGMSPDAIEAMLRRAT